MLNEAWKKGLYYRIVSVFVVDNHGRMLLQQRAPNVKVYPNRWDQAAGGHVDAGFSYEQTARNELAEELGIRDVPIQLLGTFRTNDKFDDGRIVNQFERAYLAKIAPSTPLKLQVSELSKTQWFTPTELKSLATEQPQNLTPGLLHSLHIYASAFGL
jgi:16S rRNA (adenine1518-N6/adenine1519-N6)-dimethyltransferase